MVAFVISRSRQAFTVVGVAHRLGGVAGLDGSASRSHGTRRIDQPTREIGESEASWKKSFVRRHLQAADLLEGGVLVRKLSRRAHRQKRSAPSMKSLITKWTKTAA
jgi:hypothetical protein